MQAKPGVPGVPEDAGKAFFTWKFNGLKGAPGDE